MSRVRHRKLVPFVYRSAQIALFILFKVCFRLKASGSNKVPDDGRGIIFASNHASFIDPPLFGITTRPHITFLAKDYLYKPFLFGSILRWLGTLPIKSDSDGKDLRTIRDLLRVLNEGERMVMFPEGTRSADGKLKAPESGIGFLAVKSKAWVVPAYIKGSYEAFPRHKKFFKCHPVSITYGDAFIPAEDPAVMSAPDPYQRAAEKVMDEIQKIKDRVEGGSSLNQ